MMKEETYRGYIISVTKLPGRRRVYDGNAYIPGDPKSELVTFEHSKPEHAVAELKSDIDYWLAPVWMRYHPEAVKRIERLEAVLSAIQEMAAEDVRLGNADGNFIYQIEADARAALNEPND